MLKPVIQLYFNLRTNLNESIRAVTDEVNNLLHPTCAYESTLKKMDMEETNATSQEIGRADLTTEQATSLKFKVE